MASVSEAPLLSVVVPVLNEAANLPELHERLSLALGGLDGPTEIVYVDDGSTDQSVELIQGWMRGPGPAVSLVKLARNFGMEIAMSAGLDYAQGDHVALMHADLQDPPELLPEMLAAVRNGADVAYARRIGRDESAIKRLLATGFYSLMRRVARVPYQGQAGDFRVMSRRVVEAIRRMPERRRFLRGLVAWVGYEQVPIEYRRAGRHAGRGASYPQLLALALEALTAFSDVPLQLATLFGIAIAQLSALGAVVILVLTVVGAVNPSAWVWVLTAVLFLAGVQLTTVGILGRYMARVHAEVLGRPLYLVDWVAHSQPGTSGTEPPVTRATAPLPRWAAARSEPNRRRPAHARRPPATHGRAPGAPRCGRWVSTPCCRWRCSACTSSPTWAPGSWPRTRSTPASSCGSSPGGRTRCCTA
jgi:polyisoprenyl-phosphate glycosyltransferase